MFVSLLCDEIIFSIWKNCSAIKKIEIYAAGKGKEPTLNFVALIVLAFKNTKIGRRKRGAPK